MILYAVMAQTSVVQLFVAGIIPGILGGFGLMLVSYIYAKRKNLPIEEKFNLSNLKRTGKDAALAFVLPVVILGGLFGGFVTATEGAGLAVVAACVIGAIYRELNFKQFFDATTEGASQTAIVMLLVAASVLIGEFLTIEQVPQGVASSITSITNNKYFILAILNVFLLIIGLFLHSASVLVTACSVAKADIWEVSKVNIMFIAVLFTVLMLVTYVPFIPMSLVEYFYR